MSAQRHHVVALDSWVDPPELDFPYTLDVVNGGTALDRLERLKHATILICSGTVVDNGLLQQAPLLQLIVGTGTGTDQYDKNAIRARGVTLCNVPGQNTQSVCEHAFALVFALKRRILPMHEFTMNGKRWLAEGTAHCLFPRPPKTNSEEILVGIRRFDLSLHRCVIGYGALGKCIERTGKALGMEVIIAERKSALEVRSGHIAFKEAICKATIVVAAVPLNAESRNLIGASELEVMGDTTLLVNVSRGGVVNEAALASALKVGKIGGAASDVFSSEPATSETSPLLHRDIPNLLLSPHIAWYSSKTLQGTIDTIKSNIESFAYGSPQNVVVAGR